MVWTSRPVGAQLVKVGSSGERTVIATWDGTKFVLDPSLPAAERGYYEDKLAQQRAALAATPPVKSAGGGGTMACGEAQMIRTVMLGAGKRELHRGAFKPIEYTVSEVALDMLRSLRRRPFAGEFEPPDGALRGWGQHGRVTRDGRQWALLDYREKFVEVEVAADGTIGDVVPVPPERAWLLVLEADKKFRPDIIYDF